MNHITNGARDAIYNPLANEAFLGLQALLTNPDDARISCIRPDTCNDEHPETAYRKWAVIITLTASLAAGLDEDVVLDRFRPCEC